MRSGLVLVCLLVVLGLQARFTEDWFETIGLHLVIVTAMVSAATGVRTLTAVLVVGVPSLLLSLPWFTRFAALEQVRNGFELVYLVVVTCIAIYRVVKPGRVTGDRYFSAAVGYLLLGVLWAYLYYLVYTHVPGSWDLGRLQPASQDPRSVLSEMFYFSMVTITTVGYGDIVPLSQSAKLLCVMEACVGQFYVAVLVARLVSLQIAQAASVPALRQAEPEDED